MPLRHVVLLKFKAGVSAVQKGALTDGLAKLPGVIPGLSSYHVGADAGLDPARNHDFAIVADFPSEKEYQVYAQHPAHQEVIQKFVKPLLAEGGRTAVQYSVPSVAHSALAKMPLRHVVLLKFKADASAEQKSALTEGLAKLPGVIPGLSSYHVGADAGLDPARNHDFAIVADFPSEKEYQVYAQHPAHQEVIQKFVKPLLAAGGRTAVQYSLPSSLPEQCAIEIPWSRKSMTEFRRALCQPDFAFSQTLALIDEHFDYTPQRFVNGKEESAAGANVGSCKLLSLGKLLGLSELELLTAFGEHYREVRGNPDGTSHGNIRAFIAHGWSEVKFPDGLAISVKGLPELRGFRRELCNPEFVFSKTLAFIDEHFEYTPKPFVNGGVESAAGANEGSCKLLSLGKIVGLSELELLAAFGEHQRQVRGEPDGTSHGNIRAFIAQGWNGVKFPEGIGLATKASAKRRKIA